MKATNPGATSSAYPSAYLHIDIAQGHTGEGKIHVFVAIDRTAKCSYVERHRRAGKINAAHFLCTLMATVPYKNHTVLTDNGIQFTHRQRHGFAFERRCKDHGIEHRLSTVNHTWSNGQVEGMNRTLKEATVKRYHYDNHVQLKAHLKDFISAYNDARCLEILKGLTPFEYICKIWTNDPNRFKIDPK